MTTRETETDAVRTRPPDTAERILEVAERLAQSLGYNGFSYADIAAEIGITKASLHYHFPSKANLGKVLVDRYTARFVGALEGIEANADSATAALRAYAELYEAVLVRDRLCLCTMFAAEIESLAPEVQDAVRHFFDANEAWLVRVFEQGRTTGGLGFGGEPKDAARAFAGALDGAMLVARAFGDPERFTSVARQSLSAVTPSR